MPTATATWGDKPPRRPDMIGPGGDGGTDLSDVFGGIPSAVGSLFKTPTGPAPDMNNFTLPGAAQRGDRLLGAAGNAYGRGAPQSANDSQFRGDQASLIDRLRRQMSGQDSMSALQLQQAGGQAVAGQQALAASARPGGAQAAQMNAAANAGRIQQGLAGQTAMAGIAERNAAAQALGQAAYGARGQDMQNNQFNVGAQLQQTGMNDALYQEMLRQELANAGMQQQGGQQYEAQRGQNYAAGAGQPSWGDRLLGAGMGVAGWALGGPAGGAVGAGLAGGFGTGQQAGQVNGFAGTPGGYNPNDFWANGGY